MDLILQNVNTLRDSIQRGDFHDTTVIDIFTAFHVVLQKRIIDYSISDDKHFSFILGCLRNVPAGQQREHWFETMFRTYEKLNKDLDVNSPNWLLLQANLVYLAPLAPLSNGCYS